MSKILIELLKTTLADNVDAVLENDMPTLEISPEKLLPVCKKLRDDKDFQFDLLVDVCGVDYADYGISYWRTNETTETGFNRGVEEKGQRVIAWEKPRLLMTLMLSLKMTFQRSKFPPKNYCPFVKRYVMTKHFSLIH